MEIFIGWFIFSILVGVFASSRGRSGFGYFVVSLLLSSLIGFIIVLVSKPLPTAAEREAAEAEAAKLEEVSLLCGDHQGQGRGLSVLR